MLKVKVFTYLFIESVYLIIAGFDIVFKNLGLLIQTWLFDFVNEASCFKL